MSTTMNRRAFLKTTAAAAVAVSLTGLLGGCSGDNGTDLGGFTVAVGKWSVTPYDPGIGTGKSWSADFCVDVTVHNLDGANGFSLPGRSVFVLKIDGQPIQLQAGGLLSSLSLSLSKGQYKNGTLTFRLNEEQQALYEAMKKQTAAIKLTVGITTTETYTGNYTDFTFVKDTVA